MQCMPLGLPQVVEYSRVLREYSIPKITLVIFLLIEYSLNYTSGCKFPLPVSIFANQITDLLPFAQIWTLQFAS